MSSGAGPNKYSHTPRRVFERSQDKLLARIKRNESEIRGLGARLGLLQHQLDAVRKMWTETLFDEDDK